MRRYKKKELLETADMLVEANDIIGRLCISNPDRALEILGQCQESAILLGNLIESRGEQYTGLVEILESYCENLYQMSMALSDEEQIRKLSKKIQKQLIHLNNRIRHEIPEDKKEVVFFPYKASMWDSLESVWMAADADEGTEAYVVPIPYYDKNPDGTFREMHYEGNEYPDYVPVTNWEEYDFEERRPDVMFIHNPYDEYNYVTSVHPRFYSGNLKQYTEKLVYIPYFILQEIKPDDDAAIEGMKHFCINQAVKNADKVIVQSEDMRQVYIKVLTEESGGSKEAREYWEKKIDGSGSPKVDKVLRTKKEDLVIPEEWMKVIRKPDGSWKKIIFYNTSVTALLWHGEKMLRKMELVFDIFRKYQNEVALLWRPHPLVQATIESMRPQLWEKYREIMKEYRKDGWGIYDGSADLDRAIILSDIYYGDSSSVVQLYQKTGKKIIIQSTREKLSCTEIMRYRDRIFILGKGTQSLFEYFEASESLRLCGTVEEELNQSFICATVYEGKIYMPPYEGNFIRVYDIDKNTFHNISLEKMSDTKLTKHYNVCFGYRGKLYIFGNGDTVALCMDIQNETVYEFTDWYYGFKKIYGYETGVHIHKNICVVDHCFWVPMNCENVLIQYDMLQNEYRFWNVGKRKMCYATVNYDGKYFWLTGNQKVIIRWEKETDSVKEFEMFPGGFEKYDTDSSWEDLFLCGYMWKNKLYYVPIGSNMLIRFDTESEEIKCILKIDSGHVCMNIQEINENILYLEEYESDLSPYQSYLIDSEGRCNKHAIHFSSLDDISVLTEYIEKRTEMPENHPEFLNIFLGKLKSV